MQYKWIIQGEMINVKEKGNRFERKICNFLRAWGYNAETSRYVNKRLDDMGVDIVTNAPFNIQCKHSKFLRPDANEILNRMPENKLRMITWKKDNKKTLVIMELNGFFDFLHEKNLQE